MIKMVDGDARGRAAEDPARRRALLQGRLGGGRDRAARPRQAAWEPNGRPRRAGVSSFGISGTNAHVILEEAPAPRTHLERSSPPGGTQTLQMRRGAVPLALSAKSEPALADAAERLAAHLEENPELDLDRRRLLAAHHPRAPSSTARSPWARTARSCSRPSSALAAGRALRRTLISARAKRRQARLPLHRPGLPAPRHGQGALRVRPRLQSGLRRGLRGSSTTTSTPRCKEIVFAKGKKAKALLDDTAYAQPALFAIEVALCQALAEAAASSPTCLAGHSIGEIAAAHIAGVLALADAAKLDRRPGRADGRPARRAGRWRRSRPPRPRSPSRSPAERHELSLAAVNGPTSIGHLRRRGRRSRRSAPTGRSRASKTKRLAVSHAFHSPLIEPMLEEFAEVAASPRLPRAPDPDRLQPHRRAAQRRAGHRPRLLGPPRARAGPLRRRASRPCRPRAPATYLELGPDPVLCAMAAGDASATTPRPPSSRPCARAARRRGAIVAALANAHAAGAKLDWAAFFAGTGAKRVPLPTYPFQRKRYWLAAGRGAGDARRRSARRRRAPAARRRGRGPRRRGPDRSPAASPSPTHPWLADHAVAGTVLAARHRLRRAGPAGRPSRSAPRRSRS